MDLLFFLHALLTAAAAVVFAAVLPAPEMLLAPALAWLRRKWRASWGSELDDQYWWKPIGGCPLCVSGQWGLWTYLYHYHSGYHWWAHIYFVTLAILFSSFILKLYEWSRT
jgi:hypothetical protein